MLVFTPRDMRAGDDEEYSLWPYFDISGVAIFHSRPENSPHIDIA